MAKLTKGIEEFFTEAKNNGFIHDGISLPMGICEFMCYFVGSIIDYVFACLQLVVYFFFVAVVGLTFAVSQAVYSTVGRLFRNNVRRKGK